MLSPGFLSSMPAYASFTMPNSPVNAAAGGSQSRPRPSVGRALDYLGGGAAGPSAAGLPSGQAGLGLSFTLHESGYPLVQVVEPGGPAAQSGAVQPGDLIYSANGTHLAGMPLRDVIAALVGPAGSQVFFPCPPSQLCASRCH
jgi:S1-C subfamily serine protease